MSSTSAPLAALGVALLALLAHPRAPARAAAAGLIRALATGEPTAARAAAAAEIVHGDLSVLLYAQGLASAAWAAA